MVYFDNNKRYRYIVDLWCDLYQSRRLRKGTF